MHTRRPLNSLNIWGILISLAANAAFGAGILYASSSSDTSNRPVAAEEEPKQITEIYEVLPSVEIIKPPKLGQKPPEQEIVKISNQPPPPPPKVDPKAKPPQTPPPSPPPKTDRQAPQNPVFSTDNQFDKYRPPNANTQTGAEDGSKSGQNHIGQGDPYLQHIKAQLDNNMVIPSTIPPSARKTLRAQIRVIISTNGQIMWEWMPGGLTANDAFNDMVTRTLNDFRLGGPHRFKPPPAERTGTWISITVDGSRIQ